MCGKLLAYSAASYTSQKLSYRTSSSTGPLCALLSLSDRRLGLSTLTPAGNLAPQCKLFLATGPKPETLLESLKRKRE
jgi:hypothetical protein